MKTNNSFLLKTNIRDGVIVYDGFDIDENIPLEQQVSSLREDMLQIKFGERFVLDVGWRPDFEPDGYFIVYAIQDKDWEAPLLKKKCYSLKTLKKAIEKCAEIIDEQMHIKDLPFRNVEY